MNVRNILGYAALALALLAPASACAFLDSGSDLPPVSSFHYTQTVATTIDGETTTSHGEGYYRAPDSVRVISDHAAPFFEMIVLGSQAWARSSTGWERRSADSIEPMAISNSMTILEMRRRRGLEDMGHGPITQGEPTRRYQFVNPDYGEYMAEVQDRIARSSCIEFPEAVKDAFQDQAATLDIVVGEETQNVYSLVIEVTGSGMTSHSEIVVDQYNQPVQIEPPPGAEDLPERNEAPNRCD